MATTTGYIFTTEGRLYDPNGTVEDQPDVTAHNAALETSELASWGACPKVFGAYDDPMPRSYGEGTARYGVLTTWLGTVLGVVTERHTYRNRLTGTKMTALRVKGTNGVTYWGRYGSDSSSYVTLRRTVR